MKRKPRNLRKAAVLLASLDAGHAESLLEQMSAEQAQVLRRAVERLGEIDPDEQATVIHEFMRIGPLIPDRHAAGLELDDRLPKHLAHSPKGGPDDAPPLPTTPFRFLHEAPTADLAPFLEREHPQTVALVVSHLPPQRAAEVLAALTCELQVDVARRLVDLAETDPEVLLEVERALEAWRGARGHAARQPGGGLAALGNILNAASPQAKQHILSNLARRDGHLATQLSPARSTIGSFADVERLDSASLGALVQHASDELLVLALAGATHAFAERVLALLEPGPSESVAESLADLGPTRLSDVEGAQQQLIELAQQLERLGGISPHVRGRLSVEV